VEVPAPSAGVLSKISAKEGDTVEVDAVLGMIGEAGAKASKPAAKEGKGAAKKAGTKEAEKEGSAKKQAADARVIEVRVPQSGESVTEAEIGEWLKKEGERVEADEPIVSLETDKASMEVPAPAAGVVRKIAVKEGATVEVGALLAEIETGGDGAAAKAAPAPRAAAERAAPAPAAEKPLSPAPRRVIGEYALDPAAIEGTGKDGRITKADALAAAKAKDETKARAPEPARAPAREAGPREERVKMSRLRQTIARRLKEAQEAAAMLTTFNDVDMSAVMSLRAQYKELFEKRHGVRLGFMGFFVKACIQALREIPAVNAEIDGTDIIYKNYYHIGVAVSTDKGLVVPVIREADRLSLAEIEAQISDFGRRARDGRLGIEEMQGGTFSITNGGVFGSLLSTPILNAPQSGILGMHRIEERPVVRDGQIVVRPMMYLALSYDHRIVDGKEAVTFLVRVKELLEDPQRLVLEL
jgi:2-oxoglutarate dehydrogenase E2 component (dihydrolipoamide succinyltransferase)